MDVRLGRKLPSISSFPLSSRSLPQRPGTYLGGEGSAVDGVLRAQEVDDAVAEVGLGELVAVGEGAARHVDRSLACVQGEHEAVASVLQVARHLPP